MTSLLRWLFPIFFRYRAEWEELPPVYRFARRVGGIKWKSAAS